MELYQAMFLVLHLLSLIVMVYGIKRSIKEYKTLTMFITVLYVLVLLNNLNLFFYSLKGI
jgi:hypothetical protein